MKFTNVESANITIENHHGKHDINLIERIESGDVFLTKIAKCIESEQENQEVSVDLIIDGILILMKEGDLDAKNWSNNL